MVAVNRPVLQVFDEISDRQLDLALDRRERPNHPTLALPILFNDELKRGFEPFAHPVDVPIGHDLHSRRRGKLLSFLFIG